jgi:hypothetical protein
MRELGWIAETGDDDSRRRVHRITERGRGLVAAEVARLERLLGQARPALADGASG